MTSNENAISGGASSLSRVDELPASLRRPVKRRVWCVSCCVWQPAEMTNPIDIVAHEAIHAERDLQKNGLRSWPLMSMESVETDFENLFGDYSTEWRIQESNEE
jgi:hypothetical protein